jgi:hypothetical protein
VKKKISESGEISECGKKVFQSVGKNVEKNTSECGKKSIS